jgi:hypothetical protein
MNVSDLPFQSECPSFREADGVPEFCRQNIEWVPFDKLSKEDKLIACQCAYNYFLTNHLIEAEDVVPSLVVRNPLNFMKANEWKNFGGTL